MRDRTDHHINHQDRDERPEWQRGWGRLVIWLTIGALVALGFIFIAEQAEAADTKCTWTSDCPTPNKKHRRAARKFKAGETGRSDGFRVKRVFAAPKAAQRFYVKRITRIYNQQKAEAAAAGAPAAFQVPFEGECDTTRCSAIKSYKRLTDHAKCVDRDPAIFPPTMKSCKVQRWKRPYTSEQVRNTGRVLVCGGELAISIAVRNKQFGKTIIGLTGTSCTFALWDLLD